MKVFILLSILFVQLSIVQATTWSSSTMTDPLTGKDVSSYEIMSYGSYIYNWPSKYNLVFWPMTDNHWICFNPKNGYIAFNCDFEKLSDVEKERLKIWLPQNYVPNEAPKTYEEKMLWMEKVYTQRNMDNDFWCLFYRLMVYNYEDKDAPRSLEYVNKAIPLLEAKLDTNLKDMEAIETYYLLGEYYRRIGRTDKTMIFFDKAMKTDFKDEDGSVKTGNPYIKELIDNRKQLIIDSTGHLD